MQNAEESFSRNSSSSTSRSKILIDNRFLLKNLVTKKPLYNIYDCIDKQNPHCYFAYVKPISSTEMSFNRKVKDPIKSKICPPVTWAGQLKVDKISYSVEVHEKYGPTLRKMFEAVKGPLPERDFLHLLYQLIRLVEKYSIAGYVYRELDIDSIVFDRDPQMNDLFLANIFPMRKKNEVCFPISSKFCSKGAHLGLNANPKDDLESLCYIMMYLHSQGAFLQGIQPNRYGDAKANILLDSFSQKLPALFILFYQYILALNYSDEINYFHWKNMIAKVISKETINSPFAWMIRNEEGSHQQPATILQLNKIVSERSVKSQQSIVHPLAIESELCSELTKEDFSSLHYEEVAQIKRMNIASKLSNQPEMSRIKV